MLRACRGRVLDAPVVLPLAMVAFRLGSSRQHGTNLRGLLRLRVTRHVLRGQNTSFGHVFQFHESNLSRPKRKMPAWLITFESITSKLPAIPKKERTTIFYKKINVHSKQKKEIRFLAFLVKTGLCHVLSQIGYKRRIQISALPLCCTAPAVQ